MSIKKQGEMSNELALGLRSQVEGLTEWLTEFEAWITSLKTVERPTVLLTINEEVTHTLENALNDLSAFEEGEHYKVYDED